MQFDLIVIGSGPGGYRAAVLAAQRGWKVGIVEKSDWGGCGLNRGAIPKNAWHHTAKLIAATRNGGSKRGIHGTLNGDLAQAWDHQKKLVRNVRDSYIGTMKRLSIAGFAAQAAFVDPHNVALDGRDRLSAKHFIIATGASAYVPKPFHVIENKVLTSDELFESTPPVGARVAIVGSGLIATEFAFILAMLGKDVTWLCQNPPLANSAFSADALKPLMDKLKKFGVVPSVGHRPEAVEITPDGVKLVWQAGQQEAVVDWVLLGTGRRPHTTGLNLDAAGVNCDSKGYVKVNAYLQTAQSHIYAVGDVANPRMSANQAVADAQIAIANLFAEGSRKQDRYAVPEVVTSALELARVGLNGAAEQTAPVVGVSAFEQNPRALGQDAPEGFVRLVADPDSGLLLSCEAVGVDAVELVHIIAQQYGRTEALWHLSQGCFNHPGRAEELSAVASELLLKFQNHVASPLANLA